MNFTCRFEKVKTVYRYEHILIIAHQFVDSEILDLQITLMLMQMATSFQIIENAKREEKCYNNEACYITLKSII